MQYAKDIGQIVYYAVVVLTLIITAVKFRKELENSRVQREDALRWKQAEAGKGLNDEMLEDEKAYAALGMLDSAAMGFTMPSGDKPVISNNDVKQALSSNLSDEKSIFIRDCFDALFYYFAIFDNRIKNTLILKEDIEFPLEYYIPLMSKKFKSEITIYLDTHRLTRAKNLIKRFDSNFF